MKKLLFAALLVVASVAFAAKPELPRDLTGQKIQGYAPDGRKTVKLTVADKVTNLADDLAWEAYAPGACTYRLQSTATIVGQTLTLPAATRVRNYVNPSTPYVSFSNCTSGELTRQ